jgi:hypothetical protein
VDSLVLKLVLTPALIGAASLAGRRWGPAVSGWLIGFPFTSAPIAFFLAINQGVAFAAAAAGGTMAGAISQAAFCVAYGWLAVRWGWPMAVGASCLAFALSTAALQSLVVPLVALFAVVIAALLVALRVMPSAVPESRSAPATAPRWDLGARMAVATGFVLLLTGVAPALGPRLTGLLAPFPLYGAVLAVFAHRLHGPAAAITVLRGLLVGLFAFAVFFLTLAALIERAGVGPAFAAALGLTLAMQTGALWTLQRGRGTRFRASA